MRVSVVLIIRRSSVQARPAPLGVSAAQGPEARPRRTVPDTPDVAHFVSALAHAFAGDGESSFGSALLLVLGASALGAVLAFIGGGMGGFVGSYFARRGDRKRRHWTPWELPASIRSLLKVPLFTPSRLTRSPCLNAAERRSTKAFSCGCRHEHVALISQPAGPRERVDRKAWLRRVARSRRRVRRGRRVRGRRPQAGHPGRG